MCEAGTDSETVCEADTDIEAVCEADTGTEAKAPRQPLEQVRANARRLPFRRCLGRGDDTAAATTGLFDAVICDPPYGLRKPRMLDGGAKDAMVNNEEEMQAAVAAAMVSLLLRRLFYDEYISLIFCSRPPLF